MENANDMQFCFTSKGFEARTEKRVRRQNRKRYLKMQTQEDEKVNVVVTEELVTKAWFPDEGLIIFKIKSGFPGCTIVVEESAIEGVSAQLVREDGTVSAAGE